MSTAKCPKCHEGIDYLNIYSSEQKRSIVALADFAGGDPFLDWSSKLPVSGKVQFQCPDCKAVLFEADGRNANPEKVVQFLNGYG